MTRTIRPFACRFIVVAGLVTCMASSAAAQGRVRGIVRDGNGDVVVGAKVTAESFESRRRPTDTTDDSGRFFFIGLSSGEWRFLIEADGFVPLQGSANVRRSGPGTSVRFTMTEDPFNPPVPAGGVLGGLRARELVESLKEADALFDRGEYDAAIDAYRSVLARAPALTSLSLQIGHAFREKHEPEQAIAAYRTALDADPSNAEARAAIDAVRQSVR